jgi:hypothetical protein
MANRSSRNSANSTGKSGNASGSNRREAQGDPGRQGGRGKHPPNKLFVGPKGDSNQPASNRGMQSYRGGKSGVGR